MLMKRDEGGELRPPQWELEESSYDDVATLLADGTITRARALKLAGAALLSGTGLMMLFQSPAEAGRRRKKRRRRRRRKAVATATPVSQSDATSGTPQVVTLTVTNPSPSNPLTISEVKLLGADGIVEYPTLPVTIAPDATTTIPVTITYAPTSPLVDAGELRLFDGSGTPITVLNPDGSVAGDLNLDFGLSV